MHMLYCVADELSSVLLAMHVLLAMDATSNSTVSVPLAIHAVSMPYSHTAMVLSVILQDVNGALHGPLWVATLTRMQADRLPEAIFMPLAKHSQGN